MKFSIPWYVKLGFSILLLALLATRFPLGEIVDRIHNTLPQWIMATLLLGELVMLNQAFRWRHMLLIAEAEKPPLSTFFRYTAIGYFFNLVLPGGMGGDAVKSVAFGRSQGNMNDSIASVAVARLMGLIALVFLFWSGYSLGHTVPLQAVGFMAFCTLGLLVLVLLLAFNPLVRLRAESVHTWLQKIGNIAERMKAYRHFPGKTLVGFGDSLLMQLILIAMQWCYFRAVGLDIPWGLLLVIMPISTLATMVPVSFYGIGVREWAMLALVPPEWNSQQVLASVLLGYVVVFFQAIQGALFFALGKISAK